MTILIPQLTKDSSLRRKSVNF
uniref:Uncharacterized protein n=1 Tax=Anguilla anguilla TaxID=7936 RepID=A0A0E9R390_ANGAN